MSWIAVTSEEIPETTEAYGPFGSYEGAQRFIDAYESAEVRPAYPLVAIELSPVREGLLAIRESEGEGT